MEVKSWEQDIVKCLSAAETVDKANIIELNEDYACVFETSFMDTSPSGVYGRLYQDLFVHGAQPVASLLSLLFNKADKADDPAQPAIREALAALATPGNIYGVPIVGGDVCFKETPHTISAAVMSIGMIDKAAQLRTACVGEGNHVYLLRVYDKEQPAIFSARTSYELLCDLHDAGLIVAVQSVGTNGVLGACACMVAAGSNGIALWAETLIRQPADFQDILHYVPDQIVLIVREERRSDMEQLCRKWGKQWLQIGVVIDEQKLFVKHCRITMADISADVCRMFGDAVPNTDEDVISEHTTGEATVDLPHPEDCREIAEYLLTSPNLLSQQWLFNQFDSTIGTNNLTTNFISDASVLQLKGTRHAVIAAFGSSLYPVEHYPKAVELMIADIVRKSVCSGGMPLVLTGCLQYSGISDVAFREKSALIRKQIASTCHKLGIAMSDISARYIPTDKINSVHLALGNIAFLEDKRQQMTISFKGKGDMIYLIGKSTDQLGAAEYTRYCHRMAGTQPSIDMDAEVQLLNVVQQIILRKLVKSAHNVSRGGLFMSLLESAMVRGFGFDITVDSEIRKDTFLFGEAPSRVVVSVATSRETDFIDFMMGHHVPFMTLGHVTREEIRIDDNSYGFICDYKQKYFGGLHP